MCPHTIWFLPFLGCLFVVGAICPTSLGYHYLLSVDLCLKAHISSKSWTDASRHCEGQGDRLVVLDTPPKAAAVGKFAKDYLGSYRYVWFGALSYSSSASSSHRFYKTWVWTDCSLELTSGYWLPDEPSGDVNKCGVIDNTQSGKWNDAPCTYTTRFVCEKVDTRPRPEIISHTDDVCPPQEQTTIPTTTTTTTTTTIFTTTPSTARTSTSPPPATTASTSTTTSPPPATTASTSTTTSPPPATTAATSTTTSGSSTASSTPISTSHTSLATTPSAPISPSTTSAALTIPTPTSTTTITTTPTTGMVNSSCECFCFNTTGSLNMTEEMMAVFIAEIKRELLVDTSVLIKTRLKKISIMDGRKSSYTFGISGIVLLCFPLVLMLLSDGLTLLQRC